MSTNRALIAAVALPMIAMSGCGSKKAEPITAPRAEAARLNIVADVSGSTAVLNDPEYAERVINLVSGEFRTFQLGDSATIVLAGDRSVDNAVTPPPIITGYRLRIPAARKRIGENLRAAIVESRNRGGDGSTNLLFVLENAQPLCTPRSKLVILSDGIEESESFSVRGALATSGRVDLPAPSRPYLRGCSVEMVGVGVLGGLSQGMMDSASLRSLQQGWTEYFAAAGVHREHITFRSII